MPAQQILLGGGGPSGPLTASAVPANAFGQSPTVPATVTSTFVTVNASGGTGNYTYEWEYVSGSALNFVNPVNYDSQAWQAFMPNQGTLTGTYRCKVSDGVSTVYTNNVTITLNAGTAL